MNSIPQDFQTDGKPLTGLKVVRCGSNSKMVRACNKCKLEMDESEFVYGGRPSGYCRGCNNQLRREAAQKYKEKAKALKKVCTKCSVEKEGTQFAYASKICKQCKSEETKESNNRPTADAPPKMCKKCEMEQSADQFRFQSNVCLTCEKLRLYEWRENNPDKFKVICKTYREKEENKVKRSAYLRKKYEENMNFRLEQLYRNRVRQFIKGGSKRGAEKYESILGCSWDTLRIWLESNFSGDMTWDNYGTLWHVDHTMPCAVFDFTVEENTRECFNWSNLAPMIGSENISKSCKINMALVAKIKEKARSFITTHRDLILVESLPNDLRHEFTVLDTKVDSKELTGSGEISEVR